MNHPSPDLVLTPQCHSGPNLSESNENRLAGRRCVWSVQSFCSTGRNAFGSSLSSFQYDLEAHDFDRYSPIRFILCLCTLYSNDAFSPRTTPTRFTMNLTYLGPMI